MDFVEISIIGIDGEAAETVGELFNRYGYGGAVIESYPPDFDKVTVRTVIPKEDDVRLRQIEMLLSLIGQALPTGLPEPRLQFVGESDWADSWKAHFHTIQVGRHFIIKPSWRDYRPGAGDIVLEIDPGLAFGSGLHPTTQLCLKILEDTPLAGRSFFDVGTGSGILSLAALKLGAHPIRAVDVDEVALDVARENFKRNVLPQPPLFRPKSAEEGGRKDERDIVQTAVGSAGSTAGRRWQVVVANILAHILIDLMADLAAALNPDGRLILCGIIAEQEPEILAAVQSQGLQVVERRSDGDWLALVVEFANHRIDRLFCVNFSI